MELDKRSYTARQLYHLSPGELHSAHHRILLGRAPVDLLVCSTTNWNTLVRGLLKPTNVLRRLERRARRIPRDIYGLYQSPHSRLIRGSGLNFPSEHVQRAITHTGPGSDPRSDPRGNSCGNPHGNSHRDSHRVSLESTRTCDSGTLETCSIDTISSDELDRETPDFDSDTAAHSSNRAIHYAKQLVNSTGHKVFRRHRGNILFIQQFLVQVRAVKGRYTLKEYPNIPSSTVKIRSTQYTAVARFTGRPDRPVVVYLYDTEQISRKVDHRWSRALKHKLYIDANTGAEFFDTLDLSVAVWNFRKVQREQGERTFFLFMSQSSLVQISWLFFLKNAAGRFNDHNVHVKIPQIQVSVHLGRDALSREALVNQDSTTTIAYQDLLLPEASPSSFVTELQRRLLAVVAKTPEFSQCRKKYILCWRNIDFIRTIFFETNFHASASHALLQRNALEIRPVHALTTTNEPPPIEGFCWRLSTWRGQARKQKIATRTYLHSHNHMLFHGLPNKMILPNLGQDDSSDPEKLREYFASIPINNEIDPYPLTADGNIKWCTESSDPNVGKSYDSRAVYELARNSTNIETSEGFIDMTTISSIRSLSNPLMFEIAIAGDNCILIRVAEPEARDAWVDNLRNLVKYWTDKRAELHQDAVSTYKNNLAQNTNFMLHSKAESNFALPNVSSFNIEVMARTRPVIYSNYLYEKSHKHGFFRRFYAVLTSSTLALYTCKATANRNIKDPGQPSTDFHFTLHIVYDLLKTYVYSGVLAHEYMVRESEDSFDFAQMYNGIPRLYDNDWTVQDRQADCSFVLWNSRRKHKSKQRQGCYEGRLFCMARSRIERDLWVNAFQSVTTALSMVRDGSCPDDDGAKECSP